MTELTHSLTVSPMNEGIDHIKYDSNELINIYTIIVQVTQEPY